MSDPICGHWTKGCSCCEYWPWKIDTLQASLLTTQSERDQARKERDEAVRSLEFSRDWWSTRIERLSRWVREEAPEPFKNQYFNIIANGTKDASEHPVYAQTLNRMRHRAEAAEQQVRSLEAALEQARGALKFYAIEQNYMPWVYCEDHDGPNHKEKEHPSLAFRDSGKRAREALASPPSHSSPKDRVSEAKDIVIVVARGIRNNFPTTHEWSHEQCLLDVALRALDAIEAAHPKENRL